MLFEADKDILLNFKKYLAQCGYPAQSILVGYTIGQYRADVVISDPDTNTPLQIFELKKQKTPQTLATARTQLQKHLAAARKLNPDVIGYLVFQTEIEPYFEVFDAITDEVVHHSAFDYQNQVHKGKNATATMLSRNKSRAVGNLKWATMLLIFFTALLFLLDVSDIIPMTGYRLYLILIVVILVLLPYYETIKVANFELTQKDKTAGDENSTDK